MDMKKKTTKEQIEDLWTEYSNTQDSYMNIMDARTQDENEIKYHLRQMHKLLYIQTLNLELINDNDKTTKRKL